MFLPVQAAADGFGGAVERELEAWLREGCAERDDWLAAHPPRIRWEPAAVMPYEVAADEPVAVTALAALEALGGRPRVAGLDSWFDAATLTVLGGIPAIGLGPGGLGRDGVPVAHAVDEHVPVDDLVATAQGRTDRPPLAASRRPRGPAPVRLLCACSSHPCRCSSRSPGGRRAGGRNPTAGKAVWNKNGCGSCHTFKAAGSKGKVGPAITKAGIAANAKRAKQTVPVYIKTSILVPGKYTVKGFPKGVMPAYTKLTKKQLDDLVAFIQKG
jgi:cytochrome c551/c552